MSSKTGKLNVTDALHIIREVKLFGEISNSRNVNLQMCKLVEGKSPSFDERRLYKELKQ